MQLCIWMCSGILKRNTFRVEIKSVRLYNFNSDRVIYENWRNKLLHCNCSSQWVFKCVLRQLVKIDSNFELACFDICKENLWSLSRTTGEESQLWVIRTQSGLWKGVPLNTKRILGLCKLRTCLDLMVPNHQWRLYLGSCWQQIFIGHRSYHCVPLSLTDWVIQSLLFQMTPVFKSENNSLLDAMFLALARVVDYMHGCFIHIFRVFSPFLLNDETHFSICLDTKYPKGI